MTTEDIYTPITHLEELKDKIGDMRRRLERIENELEVVES